MKDRKFDIPSASMPVSRISMCAVNREILPGTTQVVRKKTVGRKPRRERSAHLLFPVPGVRLPHPADGRWPPTGASDRSYFASLASWPRGLLRSSVRPASARPKSNTLAGSGKAGGNLVKPRSTTTWSSAVPKVEKEVPSQGIDGSTFRSGQPNDQLTSRRDQRVALTIKVIRNHVTIGEFRNQHRIGDKTWVARRDIDEALRPTRQVIHGQCRRVEVDLSDAGDVKGPAAIRCVGGRVEFTAPP